MLPQEVGFAVSADISGTNDQPVRVRLLRDAQHHRRHRGQAIHEPNGKPSVRIVLPDKICLTVTVQITNTSNFPMRIHGAWTKVSRPRDIALGSPEPPRYRTVGLLPYEIGVAVAIQISGADNFPRRVGDAR